MPSLNIKNKFKYISKNILPYLIFSVFFSLTIVIGYDLFHNNKFESFLNYSEIFRGLSMLLILTIAFTVFSILAVKFFTIFETSKANTWPIFKFPLLFAIIFFISWLPCYLAYYPGIVSYDMDSQLPQILGEVSYSKYHPPLHTFIFQLCHILGNQIKIHSLIVYSVIQMLFLAIAFSYLIKLFTKFKINNWIILASVIFICLNPIIAILSFTPAKDIFFTACLILYTVELCLFIREKTVQICNIPAFIRLVLWGTLCCLFRNNMIYAILLSAILSFILIHKKRKYILFCNAGIVVIYFLINGLLYSSLGIQDGNPREMLSVPLQQISHVMVHCDPELSEEELESLNNYLPVEELKELYNPRFADPVKNTFNSNYFKENKASFFNIWFKLLKEYPIEYISSFLNLNLPYWYINAKSVDPYANRIYIETFIYSPEVTHYNVVRDSKIPWLYGKYEVFANFRTVQEIPIVSLIFSISLPIWVMLFSCMVLFAKKKKHCIYILLPHICYWLTFLLGPVSNLRYVFPLIALYPLYLALLTNTNCFLPEKEK